MSNKKPNIKADTLKQGIEHIADSGKQLEQITLFNNIAMGVDTAEITARHQFFNPMFRGIATLGEAGLYEAIQKARSNPNADGISIPYETTGINKVYRAKLGTSVDIGGVEQSLINDPAQAQRFNARLIKSLGILYLWAMHTNSLKIYNTKVTDLIRLTGHKGRIKPEHYIDITEGIKGLFGIAITKTDKQYTDPKTGKIIHLGKNEMYGEAIRPVGEVRAVWHYSKDGRPAYIKKIVKLVLAEGMLDPTARRATILSKALLRLNTLQERQYIQLGSFISDIMSQYAPQTIKGLPIKVKLQTLLVWRGLASPENLRDVGRSKEAIKNALDKLVDIEHIAKWQVRAGDWGKLSLSGKDLDTVVLIYPTKTTQRVLKEAIIDDDEALTKILKKEVNADGITIVAKHYKVKDKYITDVINNKDTVNSLPISAYNELKAKAYDQKGATKKSRKS